MDLLHLISDIDMRAECIPCVL